MPPSDIVRASLVARSSMFSGVSVNTLLGTAASLRLYGGSTPTGADAALLSSNTLLVILPLAVTPVASTTGAATLGAIASAAAIASDKATFWRILASDGKTCHYQGDATDEDGDGSLRMATVDVVARVTISCSVGSITLPA